MPDAAELGTSGEGDPVLRDAVRSAVRSGLLPAHAAAYDLRAMYDASRADGLGDEVKRRVLMGTYALSAGYYDAYYKRAQQVR